MRAALLPTFGALSAALCLEARADAVALPPLALGNASFMDGVSRPGMLFELPLQYVRANNASDAGGHSVPGRQRVRGTTLLPHFAYLSQNTLLGAHYGAEVLLPLVRLDLDIDGGPDGRRTRQGDLIVSPLMLQWGPATLFGRPYWQRLNFVFSLPTGDYDKVWGGGHIGAGERVASDGWRPDAARVSGIGASNVQPNRNGMDCEIPARF